ncbi:MAG: DUF948 domain-containing protein [Streptosporangiaceae bacterium]|nr:DUF948 domain-containing protein [Streptosporangiaceae bacterium]MBV9856265.1 DUF948 domain-containing protein [Streptosporangiaceae bacterium]
MNATALAALIAAVSFAVLAGVGVYVMLRLARLLTGGTELVAELRGRGDALFARANAAVDRASEQLDRTDAVTASMDELGAGMSELAGQVSALAGLGRAIASGPVGRAAALAYGVRHAVSVRRTGRVTLGNQLNGGRGRELPSGRSDT